MRIGFGSTAWARGLINGHLDGIGVYSEYLWREYAKSGVGAMAVAFGMPEGLKSDPRAPRPLECIRGSYIRQVAASLLSGLPFSGTSHLKGKIDLFHATDYHTPRLRGVPVVSTVMDAIPLRHPEWARGHLRRSKNFALRRTVHWARHIITVSEFSRRDIIEAFGVDERDITAIPLGYDESFARRIDEEKRRAVLEEYGLDEGFFIFVGTLQPRKNIGRIVAAHRSLENSVRRSHPLVIVGNNGWGDEALLGDIERMESEGHGRWLKWVPREDLVALMQSASALVYPSLYEGFGLPILEGFASRVPVISSSTTSIPEVAGDAALLVDPLDTGEIASAMKQFAGDERLASELVRRGEKRLEQFSWQKCAKKTLEVYRMAS